jgi:hypothetical protein
MLHAQTFPIIYNKKIDLSHGIGVEPVQCNYRSESIELHVFYMLVKVIEPFFKEGKILFLQI